MVMGILHISFAHVHLVEGRDVGAGGKVGDVLAELPFTAFTLHRKKRLPVFDHHEINLPAPGIPHEMERHGLSLPILVVVAVFEEHGGDQVFKPDGWILAQGPVPHVELFLLQRHPEGREPKGGDPEAMVEVFENGYPSLGGLKCYPKILPEIIYRKRRANAVGQYLGQQLHLPEFSHLLHVEDILLDDPAAVFLLPSLIVSPVPFQTGLGEASKLHHMLEIAFRRSRVKFIKREGVEAMVMVASLKRIPAASIVVESGRAGDTELRGVLEPIIKAFDEVAPALELVDLVEDDQRFSRGQRAVEESFLGVEVIPAQIGGVMCGTIV